MVKMPTEMHIKVDFNSREMQEWVAQAWELGYSAGHDDGIHDQYGHTVNPFTDEDMEWTTQE
jgi:hypothetical protein